MQSGVQPINYFQASPKCYKVHIVQGPCKALYRPCETNELRRNELPTSRRKKSYMASLTNLQSNLLS